MERVFAADGAVLTKFKPSRIIFSPSQRVVPAEAIRANQKNFNAFHISTLRAKL